MKRIALAAGAVGLILAVSVWAQSDVRLAPRPKAETAEQELLKLEQSWNFGLVKSDVEFLDLILADDCMFTSPEGEALTKAQLLAELESGEDVISSAVTHDMKVRVYGDAAVVTGTSTYKEAVKGRDISGEYRWTDTWIKRGGRWQCVADHASRVAGK